MRAPCRCPPGEVIIASREFQLRPQFGIRWPVFWIWQLIITGYFERLKIKVPANWWQQKLIFPALPAVDIGVMPFAALAPVVTTWRRRPETP